MVSTRTSFFFLPPFFIFIFIDLFSCVVFCFFFYFILQFPFEMSSLSFYVAKYERLRFIFTKKLPFFLMCIHVKPLHSFNFSFLGDSAWLKLHPLFFIFKTLFSVLLKRKYIFCAFIQGGAGILQCGSEVCVPAAPTLFLRNSAEE